MDMTMTEVREGVTKIALQGRLDTIGAGEIDLRFSAATGARRAVIVDMSGVEIMTSLGVRMLLMGAKTVRNKGGKLVLLSPTPTISAVLTMAGTEQLIPVFDDEASAVAAVAG